MSSKKMTIEECLKHFAETNHINDPEGREFKVRNEISHLLGINPVTGYAWFGKFTIPKGENLLRLRYFLRLLGYSLLEPYYPSEALREFADCIALQVFSVQESANYLDTSTDVVSELILGRSGVSPQREEKIKELVNAHREVSEKNLRKLRSAIASLNLRGPCTKESTEPAKLVTKLDDGRVIETLAHLILATKPLAERVLSDDFSPEDRRRLRELTANGRSNAVFDLSNLLNRLCGERARREIP